MKKSISSIIQTCFLFMCLYISIIQPVHSKGDQPWDFFGGNDAEAETPVLWPPHAKRWLIGKDSDAGRDWGQEEKGTTEDEMAGWHHWLDGHESVWTAAVGDGQGGLECCNLWGLKESTRRNDWTDLRQSICWWFGLCFCLACFVVWGISSGFWGSWVDCILA